MFSTPVCPHWPRSSRQTGKGIAAKPSRPRCSPAHRAEGGKSILPLAGAGFRFGTRGSELGVSTPANNDWKRKALRNLTAAPYRGAGRTPAAGCSGDCPPPAAPPGPGPGPGPAPERPPAPLPFSGRLLPAPSRGAVAHRPAAASTALPWGPALGEERLGPARLRWARLGPAPPPRAETEAVPSPERRAASPRPLPHRAPGPLPAPPAAERSPMDLPAALETLPGSAAPDEYK